MFLIMLLALTLTLKTQNTKHKTQNTKHKTQNTKHKTQNTKHKTQNTKHIPYLSNMSTTQIIKIVF
jgi:hypothetical protein